MRVLIAPDSFGSLSAAQAADAIAAGWAEQAPADRLATCPLSDGGAGFVDVVLAARGGDLVPVTVAGPLGDTVPATVLVCPADADADRPETAYVEAAQACGAHLLSGDGRDPWRASSLGLGQLLEAAVATGARRVVVGVGDTASHDGGAGALAALGVGDAGRLARGGGALADLTADDLAHLPAARERLNGVELVVATATDIPLLGFHGASAVEAEGRGATPEQAQALESALGHYAHLAEAALVAGRPLGGTTLASAPGAGAGGGLAFALLLLGARQVDGVRAAVAETGLPARLRACDLVVTGEALFGWESTRAGVVRQVAEEALAVGVASVVVALRVEVGRRETSGLGLSGAYAVADQPGDQLGDVAVQQDPAGALAARARRVARTWSH